MDYGQEGKSVASPDGLACRVWSVDEFEILMDVARHRDTAAVANLLDHAFATSVFAHPVSDAIKSDELDSTDEAVGPLVNVGLQKFVSDLPPTISGAVEPYFREI